MRNILRAIAFAAALLMPALASAQCNFTFPIAANSVIGRLGVGTGPCQVIPFATLSSQLTGATITLNSGNGQTAPGAMSGGNTYNFGATTDTPRFAGIGLGGAAPVTGIDVYNAAVAPTGNSQGVVGAATVNGGIFAGQGSTYDTVIANKSLAVALGVPTGTQNVVLQGTLTAASLSTVGTIAGSLCATSAGVVLYESAVNCFAVSGITVVSGKTLTIDNTIELAGTDGTKFTFPGSSDTVVTLAATQTVTGAKTFSGTVNFTGSPQVNGSPLGTFATQNFATPPAIGGTTPAAGAFSTLTATTPVGLTSGGTNASTAATARASGGLNIDELTSHGDSNYQILVTDRTVGTSTTLTSARTWTLPAASGVNSGQTLYVQDLKGFVSNVNTLTIPRSGSDTINGGTGSVVINNANGGFLFISDGVSNWSAQALGAQATAGVASINGQTGNPSIVSGTGITVSTSGGNITVANAAVTSVTSGAGLQVGSTPGSSVTTTGTVSMLFDPGSITNCTLVGTVSGNALTVALKTQAGIDPTSSSPCIVSFRSATIATGDYTPVQVIAATSFVTGTSGSTFGAANATPFRLWITAWNNAGTVVLGVSKQATSTGIAPLNESAVQSSTACNACTNATATATFYTTATQTSKAIRILGYMDWASGLTTAGTWASGPTTIQLFGPGVEKPGKPVQSYCQNFAAGSGTASSASTSFTDTNTTLSITLTSAVNSVAYNVSQETVSNTSSAEALLTMARGGVAIGPQVVGAFNPGGVGVATSPIIGSDFPGSVGPIAYTVRGKTPASTFGWNDTNGGSTECLAEIQN